ncbi:hypothetical protein MXB_2746 [Myxobolus squamalis]|nr:hypothetical protein MXB_2746 [Myxobolus squamalis]
MMRVWWFSMQETSELCSTTRWIHGSLIFMPPGVATASNSRQNIKICNDTYHIGVYILEQSIALILLIPTSVITNTSFFLIPRLNFLIAWKTRKIETQLTCLNKERAGDAASSSKLFGQPNKM